jgi:hypothetical protein
VKAESPEASATAEVDFVASLSDEAGAIFASDDVYRDLAQRLHLGVRQH